MAGLLISISGMDGAGKTTQLRRLAEALEARGRKTAVCWHRPGYSRTLDALRSAVRRLRPGALPAAGDGEARARAFKRPFVRWVWIMMALWDSFLQYGVKFRVLRLLGKTVLADRYLADGLLDLDLRFPEQNVSSWITARLARALCPRPRAAFLLMLPPDEAARRAASKQEPFPDPPALREQRGAAYRRLAESGAFEVLDASRSVQEVHAEILRILDSKS